MEGTEPARPSHPAADAPDTPGADCLPGQGARRAWPRVVRGAWGRPPRPRSDSASQFPTEGGNPPRGLARGSAAPALRDVQPSSRTRPHSPRRVATATPPAGSRGLVEPQGTSGFPSPIRETRDGRPSHASARAHAQGPGLGPRPRSCRGGGLASALWRGAGKVGVSGVTRGLHPIC